MEEVDAMDNGIHTHDGPGRYQITTNLSSRVGSFHPVWNEKNPVNSFMFAHFWWEIYFD